MGDKIKFIEDLIKANAFTIICTILVMAVIIIIIVIDTLSKKNRYVIWKKQTINLGIYSREWERTEDVVLQQLFDENKRLEAENQLLKKKYNQLSFLTVLSLLSIILISWFKTRKHNS